MQFSHLFQSISSFSADFDCEQTGCRQTAAKARLATFKGTTARTNNTPLIFACNRLAADRSP